MTSNRLAVLAGTIQSAHRLVTRRAQETAESDRYHVRSLWLPPEEELGGYFETTRRPVPFDFLRVNLMLTLGTDDWSASVVAADDPLADFVWRAGEQVMGDAA